MTNPAPQPDIAWHLRRLLEVVTEACGSKGRWGWLIAPMALLTWFRTRRERREAAEAMEAFKGLLQGFLTLLEDFRGGRLEDCATEVEEAQKEESAPTPIGPLRGPIPRFAGFGREADQRGNGTDGATAPPPPRPSALEVEGEAELACTPQSSIEDTAPLCFSAPCAVITGALVPVKGGRSVGDARRTPACAGMAGTGARVRA